MNLVSLVNFSTDEDDESDSCGGQLRVRYTPEQVRNRLIEMQAAFGHFSCEKDKGRHIKVIFGGRRNTRHWSVIALPVSTSTKPIIISICTPSDHPIRTTISMDKIKSGGLKGWIGKLLENLARVKTEGTTFILTNPDDDDEELQKAKPGATASMSVARIAIPPALQRDFDEHRELLEKVLPNMVDRSFSGIGPVPPRMSPTMKTGSPEPVHASAASLSSGKKQVSLSITTAKSAGSSPTPPKIDSMNFGSRTLPRYPWTRRPRKLQRKRLKCQLTNLI